MHFELRGKEDAPLIVLFGVPCCSMDPYRTLAGKLQNDCQVLLVTWDGHEQREITYTSARDQAAQTVTWLRNSGIRRIALLCAFGDSGKAAMEMARMISEDHDWHLGQMLFDGCALAKMGWLRRAYRLGVLRVLQRRARRGEPQAACAKLRRSLLLKSIVGSTQSYDELIRDFVRVSRNISDKSTIRVVKDACRCVLHELPERMTHRMIFVWAKGESARLSRRRIMKQYPMATSFITGQKGPMGFMTQHTDQYARMLIGLTQMPGAGKTC